jgi:hypothetical protein
MDEIGEVDGRGAARQRLHFPFRREDVDVLRIQLDPEVLHELVRVADFLLHLEQPAQPLEVLLVPFGADPTFLVLPVRRNPLFGDQVHLIGSDLNLKRHPEIAHDRRVQR